MSFAPIRVYTVTMASGATLTTSYATVDIGCSKVLLEVPTMASGSIFIKGSTDASTFRRICVDNGNTATAQIDFTINSSVTQRYVPVPVGGMPYLKVELSTGCTDVVTVFKFICGD